MKKHYSFARYFSLKVCRKKTLCCFSVPEFLRVLEIQQIRKKISGGRRKSDFCIPESGSFTDRMCNPAKFGTDPLYQFSIGFIQCLPSNQGRRSPELKVWDIEMIRKSCQNSVSLHFGTPKSDKNKFNGDSVLYRFSVEIKLFGKQSSRKAMPVLCSAAGFL